MGHILLTQKSNGNRMIRLGKGLSFWFKVNTVTKVSYGGSMAFERPIVTVAAVEEHRAALAVQKDRVEQEMERLDGEYKAWKSKLDKELLAEYNRIQTTFKNLSKCLGEFLKEREVFRQKAKLIGLSTKLSEAKPVSTVKQSVLLAVSHFSSPRPNSNQRPHEVKDHKSEVGVWVAPLHGLPGEMERRKKLNDLQSREAKATASAKLCNNFMSPRHQLKPLERAPAFLGGALAAKAMQPSVSEKQLNQKGNEACVYPPSSLSLKIKPSA